MPRIIITGASEASRTQLSRVLTASGFDIFRLCASVGELRRTMNACEDGIVILAGRIADCLPEDLLCDFWDSFQLLLLGRPETLNACDSPRVFKLAYPCPGSAVVGAVEMLTQLHTMRLPRRQGRDKALVEDAKRLLMQRDGIDEPTAHRRIQVYAMRHNMKMTDYAAQLLQGGSNDV